MNLYLETSSLVKLYVAEESSDTVRTALSQVDTVGTSRVTYVEARAAIARKLREENITKEEHRRSVGDLENEWGTYVVLDLTDWVARKAGEMADKHALRGFDAIHLASAMAFHNSMGTPVLFLCADRKLTLAARTEGLKIG